jgi:glutaconate CoA-transferase subunit B
MTARGNVSAIVTPLCVFTMYYGELILHSIHPTSTIDEVAQNTGFPIKYIDLKTTPAPTDEELRLLQQIDPEDLRNIEFR